MRQYLCVLGVVALSTGGCARSVDVEEQRMALLEVDRQWAQSTKDLDLFMSFWAPDATAYPPAMPAVSGADAIRKTFGEMSSAPGFALSWTPSKAEVAATGDVGYTTGTYEMTMNGTKDSGKYVTVWRKQPEGTWKVVEDIFNTNLPPGGAPAPHAMVTASAIKWVDPPPFLPPGARVAVMSGDPMQAGPFVVRLQVPAGYRVAPHWHPNTENITVFSGTIAMGLGETFDESALQDLSAGGFGLMPGEARHYFLARTASTFQVHGIGPFTVNYVNPADDPSRK